MESIIKNTPASQQPTFTVTEKIGHTTYEARAYCSTQEKATFEDKFLRVIHHAALDFFGTLRGSEATNTEQIENLPVNTRRMLDIRRAEHGIIGIPQTSRQSERSA